MSTAQIEQIRQALSGWGTRRSLEDQLEKILTVVTPWLDELDQLREERWSIVATRNAAIERAEKAEQHLIASVGFDMADLMRSLDDCVIRAERAEAESSRRGDLLNAVVELIEHRQQRYTETNGTTIRAVPVADLRRAIGMED